MKLKTWILGLFIGFAFVCESQAGFYDSFLSNAIADCPGFIGGDSQLSIEVPYNRPEAGFYRFRSVCTTTKGRAIGGRTEYKTGNPDETPSGPDDQDDDKDPRCEDGSIIRPGSGSVGEMVPVAGTDFQLVYFSDRVKGRVGLYSITIPVFDSNTNVTGYNIYAEYAGRRTLDLNFVNSTSSTSNRFFVFQWDGKDEYGNAMLGGIPFDYTLNIKAHGKTIPVYYKNFVGAFNAEVLGFGLWMPSIYHFYDKTKGRLVRGDGTTSMLSARTLSNGQLIVAKADESEFYIFDENGKHLFTKFGITGENKYQFLHNGSGKLSSITDAFGKVTIFTRVSDLVTEITAPKGLKTYLSYDGSGYLKAISNPQSEVSEMTYYPGGLIKSFKKPGGQSSHFYYDSKGSLTKDYHSSGYFVDITKWISGTVTWTRLTTPRGIEKTSRSINTSQFYKSYELWDTTPLGYSEYTRSDEYSQNRFVHSNYFESTASNVSRRFPESGQAGGSRKVSINGNGVIAYETYDFSLDDEEDPLSLNSLLITKKVSNKVRTSNYTASNKKWTYTSAEGRVSSQTINDAELPTQIQVGDRIPYSMNYNSDGKLQELRQGPRLTRFQYDSRGYLQKVVNALGHATEFVSDNVGRVTQISLPSKSVISIRYDKNGKQIGITPPEKPEHSFLYTAFEKLKEYIPVDLGFPTSTQYKYNLDKQIAKVVRPDGKYADYIYGEDTGLLDFIALSNGGGNYYFAYNALVSDLAEETSPDELTMQYTYYGPYRATETQSFSSLADAQLLRSFDGEHKVKRITLVSNDEKVSSEMRYDKDNLLIGNGPLVIKRETPEGMLTSVSLGSIQVNYVYSPEYGELKGISYAFNNKPVNSIHYKRDLLGRIVTEQTSSKTVHYSYDPQGRYIAQHQKDPATPTHEYRYTANGTRVYAKTPEGETTARHDDQDRLLRWNNHNFNYNANGDVSEKINISTSDTTSYVYDVFGNLKSVTLPNSDVIEYKVDARNRRVLRYKNSVLQTRYVWDSQLRIAAVLNAAGEIRRHFLYADSVNVPEAMITADGTRYLFLKDVRGSVLKVINTTTGAIGQELEYDDWGRVTKDTNPAFQPFGYAGGLYDHETGLVRFGARDYDAMMGRWMSKDPILFAGGDTNLYGYVMQDPVNFVDPSGLAFGDWWDPRTYWPPSVEREAERATEHLGDHRSQPRRNDTRHCYAACMASLVLGKNLTEIIGDYSEKNPADLDANKCGRELSDKADNYDDCFASCNSANSSKP